MPSSYTPSLRFTLPADGELSGTWGQVVNNGITSLVDAAIAGYASVAMTDADHTLTVASGSTDNARRMLLNFTGALSAQRDVICPTASKLYFIKNSTSGGFGIRLKTSAGTGIVVPNGKTTVLYCDGTNVTDAITSLSSLTLGSALPVSSGGTGMTSLTGLVKGNGTGAFSAAVPGTDYAPATTSSAILYGNGTGGFSSVTIGSGLSFVGGTLTNTAAGGTVSPAGGGTGLTSYTIGDLLYASGATTLSKLADIATGNALISGGVGVAPSWGKVGLTTHVSGTLPAANGGTGLTSWVAGTDYMSPGGANTFTAKQTYQNGNGVAAVLYNPLIKVNSASITYVSGPFGTANIDLSNGKNVALSVIDSFNGSYSAIINFRWNSATTLDSVMAIGETVECDILFTNGTGTDSVFSFNTITVGVSTVTAFKNTAHSSTLNRTDRLKFRIHKTGSGVFTVVAEITNNLSTY